MSSLFYKQQKPLTVKILGCLMLLFAVYLWATDSGPLNQKVVLGILSIVVLGYSITFQIGKEFTNYKHFQLFGLTFFKSRLSIHIRII